MNKKQYISPRSRMVELDMESLVANSIQTMSIDLDDTNAVSSTESVWTKENKSLWDNEW